MQVLVALVTGVTSPFHQDPRHMPGRSLTNGNSFPLYSVCCCRELIVRAFLITLTASTVGSVILWQLGLAAKISPAHPLLTTVILAAVGAAVVQLFLTYDPTTRLK